MPVELAPLSGPEGDDWLERVADPGARLWLLRGDAQPLMDVLRSLLEDRPRDPGSWVGVVEGTLSRVRYVAPNASTSARRRRLSAVVGPMGSAAAVAMLDRVETAPVDTLLLRTEPADAAAQLASLRAGQRPVRFDRLVLTRAGQAWAIIGLPGEAPPDVPGVLAGTALQRVPPAPPDTWRGLTEPGRQRSLVAGVVAVVAVALAAWLGLARSGSLPAPAFPPAAGLPRAVGPEPANVPALAFDAARQDAVMFGGLEPGSSTWLWSRRQWEKPAATNAPADRSGAASAYDVARRRLLIFGGREVAGHLNNDTWAWDGRSWTRLGGAQGDPPSSEYAGMAWDPTTAQMVLVTPPAAGGAPGLDQTWLLTDARWVAQTGVVAPPSEPSSALAFDPATHTMLLALGGLSIGASPSTWSWDGGGWRQLHPAHEPALGGFTSFLSPIPGAAKLLLARLTVDFPQVLETWIWDGRDWTRASPGVSPTGVIGMVAVPGTGVVAFGHAGRNPALIAWIWTGATWARA